MRSRVRCGRRRSFALTARTLLLSNVRIHGVRAWKTCAGVLSVVMYSLHVVKQVVPPWEAISRKSSLAAGVEAKVWTVAVTVHAMGLPFVAEQAGSGGELLLGASLLSAAEGLEMRIDEFAAEESRLETHFGA